MITKVQSVKNLIGFDASKAQVTRVSAKGQVTLQVKYEIDLVKALRLGIMRVDLRLKKVSASDSSGVFSNRSTLSPEEVLDSVLNRSARRKSRAARRKSNVVFEQSSDITKKVSNSVASRMSSASGAEAEKLLGEKRHVRSVRQRDLNEIAADIPIVQTPVHVAENSPEGSGLSQNLSQNAILRRGVSPTVVGNFEATFSSTEDSIKGVIPRDQMRSTSHIDVELLKRTYLREILDISSAAEILPDDRVPVQSYRTSRKASIVETLQLTDGGLDKDEGHYILEIEAVDSDGNSVESSGCLMNIVEKVADTGGPMVLLPDAGGRGLQSDGNPWGTVSEDDLDTTDTSIFKVRNDIFRSQAGKDRVSDPTFEEIQSSAGVNSLGVNDSFEIWAKGGSGPFLPPIESSWDKVGSIITGGLPEILIQQFSQADAMSMIGTTIIRLVGLGSRASDFAEIVLPGINNHPTTTSFLLGPKTFAETDNRFSSVTAFNRMGWVDIRVAELVAPGSVMVVRRDLTLHEQTFVPLEIDDPIRLPEGSSALIFRDQSVKEDHVYEYRAKVFTREGREILTTGRAIITYRLLNGNAVLLNVGYPLVTVDSVGEIDVRFTLEGSVPETGLSALNSVLERVGLSRYFNISIEEDRSKLSDLLAYSVKRVDMKMGEEEDFGVVTGAEFSDKDLRKTTNVSPLRGDRKYRYIVSALLRTPDTLIDNATRTEVDLNTLKEYTFKPSRYLRPQTLKRGALAATDVVVGTDLEDEMLAGFAGVQRFIDVSTGDRRPSIVSASVKRNARGHNVIRWRVKGSTKLIDHFVVVGTMLGMRTIVGKSHSFSSNGTFSFSDKRLSKLVGEVTYQVVPVYVDYKHGEPAVAGKIESLSEIAVKKQ